MKSNIVYPGQSFLDKVVELSGDIENAFDMATLNNQNQNFRIEVGSTVISTVKKRKRIVALFNDLNRPATEQNTVTIDYYLPGEFPYSF